MSIASEITRISTNVSNAYSAANAKGATMPTSQNSDNLATTIASIPSGTIEGVYRTYRVVSGVLYNAIDQEFHPFPSDMENVSDYMLYRAYAQTPASVLSGEIDLSMLKNLSGVSCCENMFAECPGNLIVDMSNLVSITGATSCKMMFGRSGITSANLSSLKTVTGANACDSMFYSDRSLTSIGFPSLETVSGASAFSAAFYLNTSLTSLTFPKLSSITGRSAFSRAFSTCYNLTSISFPALKSDSFGTVKGQFSSMLELVTGCTLHFPSNLDPETGSTVISSLNGYPDFGGTNTVLAFDLPATE